MNRRLEGPDQYARDQGAQGSRAAQPATREEEVTDPAFHRLRSESSAIIALLRPAMDIAPWTLPQTHHVPQRPHLSPLSHHQENGSDHCPIPCKQGPPLPRIVIRFAVIVGKAIASCLTRATSATGRDPTIPVSRPHLPATTRGPVPLPSPPLPSVLHPREIVRISLAIAFKRFSVT